VSSEKFLLCPGLSLLHLSNETAPCHAFPQGHARGAHFTLGVGSPRAAGALTLSPVVSQRLLSGS
jgi:hypothetical protein